MRRSLLVFALLLAPTARAARGGGPSLLPAQLDGALPCVGGVGLVAEDRLRVGGEAALCAGQALSRRGPDARLGTLGMQLGWQSRTRRAYATAFSGFGAGGFGVERSDGHVGGTVLYVRPSVGGGVPLGPRMAVEGTLFVSVNAPIYQRAVDTRAVPVFPTGGLQVSLLFGDFRRDRPDPPPRRAPIQPADLPERPLAVVPPQPPPPPRP